MADLSYFNRCVEEGTVIQVVFQQIDRERGQYVAYSEKLRVVLPLTEYFGTNKEGLEEIWKTARIGQALGVETDVIVKNVNMITGTVTCSREGVRSVINERAKEEEKEKIDAALNNGDTYEVSGRIVEILGKGKDSFAVMRTQGGHRVVINVKNWNHEYMEDIRDGAQVGQSVRALIYRSFGKKKATTRNDYFGSRRDTLPPPEVKRMAKRDFTKAERREIIDAALEAGEQIAVTAKVVEILGTGNSSRAILTTKEGIRLCLMCSDWDYDYIDDIKDVVKPWDMVRVAVYGKNTDKDKMHVAEYMVSRRRLMENPWKGIEEKFHKGDLVTCRVKSKWNGGYSGRIDGLEGIVAFVSYPKDERIRMVAGGRYICSVHRVSEEKRLLKVFPFAVCKSANTEQEVKEETVEKTE